MNGFQNNSDMTSRLQSVNDIIATFSRDGSMFQEKKVSDNETLVRKFSHNLQNVFLQRSIGGTETEVKESLRDSESATAIQRGLIYGSVADRGIRIGDETVYTMLESAKVSPNDIKSEVTAALLSTMNLESHFSANDVQNNKIVEDFITNPWRQKLLDEAIDLSFNTNFVLNHLVSNPIEDSKIGVADYNFFPVVNALANRVNAHLNEGKDTTYLNIRKDGVTQVNESGEKLYGISPDLFVMEGYDGQYLDKMTRLTLALAVGINPDDPVTDALFPAIPIDAKNKGYEIVIPMLYFTNRFIHNPSGNETRKTKIPFLKSLYDEELWLVNYLAIDPIVKGIDIKTDRPLTDDRLLLDFSYVSTVGGNTHLSAPVKVGSKEPFSYLGLCSSDANIKDSTDTLERSPTIIGAILRLGSGNDAEYFELNTSASVLGNGAIGSLNGSLQEQTIKLEDDSYNIIIGSNAKCLQSLAEGRDPFEPSTFFKESKIHKVMGLPEDKVFGITVQIRLLVDIDMGTSNIRPSNDNGAIRVLKVTDLTDGSRVLPTTDPNYQIIYKYLEKDEDTMIRWKGVILSAQVTNSNRRIIGNILTIDAVKSHIVVPFQTGQTVEGPLAVMDYRGDNNDINNLPQLATLINQSIYHEQYQTLQNYIASLRQVSKVPNFFAEKSQLGIGASYLNCYFKEIDIDIPSIVDSRTSSERLLDVKASLLSIIRLEALTMLAQSNYYSVLRVLKGGQKATLVLATDLMIGSILTSTNMVDKNQGVGTAPVELTNDLDVKVVTSTHRFLQDKIIGVFCRFGSDRHETIDPLQFGNTFISPPFTYHGTDQSGTTVSRYITTIGRYQSIVHTPVMFIMNILNHHDAFGKLETFVRTNAYTDLPEFKQSGFYKDRLGVSVKEANGAANGRYLTHLSESENFHEQINFAYQSPNQYRNANMATYGDRTAIQAQLASIKGKTAPSSSAATPGSGGGKDTGITNKS